MNGIFERILLNKKFIFQLSFTILDISTKIFISDSDDCLKYSEFIPYPGMGNQIYALHSDSTSNFKYRGNLL